MGTADCWVSADDADGAPKGLCRVRPCEIPSETDGKKDEGLQSSLLAAGEYALGTLNALDDAEVPGVLKGLLDVVWKNGRDGGLVTPNP